MRNKIFFYFVYNTERGRIGYTRKGATAPADGENSRTHRLRQKHRAVVDDVGGILETSIADFFAPVAVVAHVKVHGFIAYAH